MATKRLHRARMGVGMSEVWYRPTYLFISLPAPFLFLLSAFLPEKYSLVNSVDLA